MTPMWGDRSGREPTSARSALALRRVIAAGGSAVCLIGFVALAIRGFIGWGAFLLLAMAVVGVVDIVVITRRLRRKKN